MFSAANILQYFYTAKHIYNILIICWHTISNYIVVIMVDILQKQKSFVIFGVVTTHLLYESYISCMTSSGGELRLSILEKL